MRPDPAAPDASRADSITSSRKPRYLLVREALRRDIDTAHYAPGDRLPTDADLAVHFETSRLTVIRALRELESEGVVQRKAGSGTFVRSTTRNENRVFGLLMPDLGEGEVFEPIARAIASSGEAAHHTMLWGDIFSSGADKEKQAEDLCRYFISRKVGGVFFSPVELTPNQDAVNRRIAGALDAAGIPIVLIDRCYCAFPERSRYDLAGIDNRRAGYRMTQHLIHAGCRHIAFAYRHASASTVYFRRAGYLEALSTAGLRCDSALSFESECEDTASLEAFMHRAKPDGFVCANDLTAARLMHSLLKLGVRIPEDVRMAGINDVKYAMFLPVPLTTLRQPCQQIGAAALSLMLDRIERPDVPTRDLLLDCELIVRQSCGTP